MFITFEGIDGSGKTTQAKMLFDYFCRNNIKAKMIREPGGTVISEKIRGILLDKSNSISDIAELLLFQASRAELINQIVIPALKENTIVISDRFIDSTVAYQGYGKNIDVDIIKKLNKIATNNIQPDCTFYLKIDHLESLKRKKTEQLDRFESNPTSFMHKVSQGFDIIAVAEKERFIIIDATITEEEIHNLIINELSERRLIR